MWIENRTSFGSGEPTGLLTLSRGYAFSLKNIQNRVTGPYTRERSKKNDLSGLIAPDFIDAVAQHIQYLSDWSSLGNVVSD